MAKNVTKIGSIADIDKLDNLKIEENYNPLLDEQIIQKDYTRGPGAGDTKNPLGPDPFSEQKKPLDGQTHIPKQEPAADVKPESKPFADPPKFKAPPSFAPPVSNIADVPEQEINFKDPIMGAEGPNPLPENNVPDKLSQEAASGMADTILSMYKSLLPEITHGVSKLDTKTLKSYVQSGDMDASVLEMVREENEKNKREFRKRAKEDAELLADPLRKTLAVKNVNVPPHVELLIMLAFVVAMNVMMLVSIKKENASLMAMIYARIKDKRADKAGQENKEEEIPFAETETL
jgi:hypothetical protein